MRETLARTAALVGLAGDRSRVALRLDAYDRKTEAARLAAGQRPVPPGRRAAALSRQLHSARDQRRLARAVEDEVNRLGVRPTLMVRKLALDYGRMVWRTLELTADRPDREPAGRGRPRKTRAVRLAEAEARAKQLGPGILPARAYRRLRAQVGQLHELTPRSLT